MGDLGIGKEGNCELKVEENVELKHDGLDNEGFENEGWVDGGIWGYIYFVQGLVEVSSGFTWTTHYSMVDYDGWCSIGDFFGGKCW